MGLLPDIEDGKIKEEREARLYKAPKWYYKHKEEEKLGELNNLGQAERTEDFSDSPLLER